MDTTNTLDKNQQQQGFNLKQLETLIIRFGKK
jgi:hypothetical protein